MLPLVALAAVPPLITNVMKSLIGTATVIAGGVTVICWLAAGVLFLTAQGDPAKVTLGKKAVFAAIVGTLLVIVASSGMALVSQSFGIK